ncbi:MAG: formyltransferase family protein [Anaerolineales bacterium]
MSIRILWIGGNHPRHLYYINTIAAAYPLAGALIETRENLIPSPPERLDEVDRRNFIRHFDARANAEKHYFGEQELPDCHRLEVPSEQLNSERSVEFVRSIDPDLVLIFGSGLIKDPLYSALPKDSINLHLGVSPRYRGAATLFWPFYFMEPAYAGTTFHYIIAEPDAGDVVHQVTPELDRADGVHDVACKAVMASANQAVSLLEIFEREGSWKIHRQRGTGKNFLSSDFKPEHLRVLYNVFDDDIVARYLDGDLPSKEPPLYRQF